MPTAPPGSGNPRSGVEGTAPHQRLREAETSGRRDPRTPRPPDADLRCACGFQATGAAPAHLAPRAPRRLCSAPRGAVPGAEAPRAEAEVRSSRGRARAARAARARLRLCFASVGRAGPAGTALSGAALGRSASAPLAALEVLRRRGRPGRKPRGGSPGPGSEPPRPRRLCPGRRTRPAFPLLGLSALSPPYPVAGFPALSSAAASSPQGTCAGFGSAPPSSAAGLF